MKNNRKGMCSRCSLSKRVEGKKHLMCLRYRKFCMSVARNCPGPVERLLTPAAPDAGRAEVTSGQVVTTRAGKA